MKKIFLGFFLISTLINSQEIEFEKVTVDELKMTHYEKDSSANAVVLIEKHNITSNPAKYNRYKKQYYVKIKILNKTGFDWGDFAVPFYESNRGEIKIQSIKGLTVYKENGQTKESKVEKENLFEEETGKYRRLKKFSMPQLTES